MGHKEDGRDSRLRILPGEPIIRPSFTGCDRRDAYTRASLRECPLFEPDDRLAEAQYFLVGMLQEYHNPEQFRWNLNAFLQALRNVTFVLQKQLAHTEGFGTWWSGKQAELRGDELLRAFVEGRNLVVKQGNLEIESKATLGVFRDHRCRAGFTVQVPSEVPSHVLLSTFAPKLEFIDDAHSAIGEEYGVDRDWIARELGDGNVVDLCDQAWRRVSAVMDAAHQFVGIATDETDLPEHKAVFVRVLTESDVDTDLPHKWGWT